MNNPRRKALNDIIAKLEDLKEDLEALKEEEEEAYNNLPEGFQDGEKGSAMWDAIDNMDCGIYSLEEAIDYITEATN